MGQHHGGEMLELSRVGVHGLKSQRLYLMGVVRQDVNENVRVVEEEVKLIHNVTNLTLGDHLVEVWHWVIDHINTHVLEMTQLDYVTEFKQSTRHYSQSSDDDGLDGSWRGDADEPGFRHHFRLQDAEKGDDQAADSRPIRLRRFRHIIRLIREPIRLIREPIRLLRPPIRFLRGPIWFVRPVVRLIREVIDHVVRTLREVVRHVIGEVRVVRVYGGRVDSDLGGLWRRRNERRWERNITLPLIFLGLLRGGKGEKCEN